MQPVPAAGLAGPAGWVAEATRRLREALDLWMLLWSGRGASAAGHPRYGGESSCDPPGFANRPQEALNDFEWAVSLAEEHDHHHQAVLAHNNAGDHCLNGDSTMVSGPNPTTAS